MPAASASAAAWFDEAANGEETLGKDDDLSDNGTKPLPAEGDRNAGNDARTRIQIE